ncbi:MAG: hypothetical protein ACFCUO_01425 [Rhodospirillales bacterium]
MASLLLGGCGTPPLPETGIDDPTPARFAYCRDNTCKTIKVLGFDDVEWAAITDPLGAPAADAASERDGIAAAVGAFERKAGTKAGTSGDIGGTIKGMFRSGQLDCVDEASNTHTLLGMLEADGLLRWHRRGAHATRLVILSDGVPHFTATVVEIATGHVYAVDSWFRDNGHPADVVLLDAWRAGWNPD